jgi:hypothetical protein
MIEIDIANALVQPSFRLYLRHLLTGSDFLGHVKKPQILL